MKPGLLSSNILKEVNYWLKINEIKLRFDMQGRIRTQFIRKVRKYYLIKYSTYWHFER